MKNLNSKLILLLLLVMPFMAISQTSLFLWNFDDQNLAVDLNNTVGTPSMTEGAVLSSALYFGGMNVTTCATTGEPANNFARSNAGWDAGDHYQFTVNATGFTDMTYSVCLRTSTAANSTIFRVRASADGTNWSTIVNDFSFGSGTGAAAIGVSGALPAVFNNAPTVYIQVYCVNTLTSATQAIRIDNSKLVSNPPPPVLHYRSVASGLYSASGTWASSTDGITWAAATRAPVVSDLTISIQSTHTVTIAEATTLDQIRIKNGGTLFQSANSGVAGLITINDGSGDDIVVENGGVFQFEGAASSTPTPQTYASRIIANGSAAIRVETGGVIRLGNGSSSYIGSGFGVFATNTNNIWENSSILDWNNVSNVPFQGNFFPNAVLGVVPILRISVPVPGFGGSSTTAFSLNGLLEANEVVHIGGTTSKSFRDGIYNADSVVFSSNVGKVMIGNGTSSTTLSGSGPILLPIAGCDIASSTNITLINHKTIVSPFPGALGLNLTSGFITLGNHDLFIKGTGGRITGSPNGYVITNGTGKLKMDSLGVNGTINAVNFPVGSSVSNYNPVSISNSGTIDEYAVNVSAGTACGIGPTQSVGVLWNIAESTTGGSLLNLQCQWSSSQEGSLFNRNSCRIVGCDNSSVITSQGTLTAATGTNPYSTTISGVTSLFNFGVNSLDADMSATGLVSPTDGGCKSSTETVTVSVKNNSGTTIDFSINNVLVSVSTASGYSSSNLLTSGTLSAGTSMNVTMPATIDMSAGGTFIFSANTQIVGDNNTSNDAMPAATISSTTAPSASIGYVGSPFCTSVTTAEPVSIIGNLSGTFSSTSGLTLDANFGSITPSSSTPGSYIVTYTIPAAGGCPVYQATTPVVITASPSATISYTGSPYCTSVSGSQAVTLTGTTGGSFSAAAGLTIDASSGAITPSTSTPGTYVVTYTIASSGGCATYSTTSSVVITQAPNATIAYSNSSFCSSNSTIQPAIITGVTGGSFSATAGLAIDAASGDIMPSSSTPGTYTVTYTIAAAAGCASFSTSVTISIITATSASFSYTASPYCSNAVNPFPTLAVGATAGVFSSTAGLTFVNNSTGQVDLSASTPGTYIVTNTVAANAGCPAASETTTITITQISSANISYVGLPYCSSVSTPQLATITGTSGGVFSSTVGLSINSVTGAITPSTSTPGTYVVTYTIPAQGGCAPVSTTTTVVITQVPSVSISYAGLPYCSSLSTPQPATITGTSGGVFSSTVGLSINSGTGAITPSMSTPGTYVVTYTIPAQGGCASVSATASVVITQAPTASITYAGIPYCSSVSTPQAVIIVGSTGGTFSSTAGLSIQSGTGAITPSTSTPGTYVVTYTIAASGGCGVFTTTANVTINSLPTASISYPGSPFCSSTSGTGLVSLTGTSGGVFSSTPGLSLNSGTGAITPSTSTPGTYTVTYTIPAQGGCASVSTTTAVTITQAPVASITYAGAPFCVGTGIVSVTRTGSPGGTYSSVAGLSLNAATGDVNLNASTPGIYNITYTIASSNGCATFSTSTSITINAVSVAPTSITSSKLTNCGPTTVTLTQVGGTLAPGATWRWYSGSCGGTSIGVGSSISNVPVSATTTFYVRAEGGVCGSSSCASTAVTIYAIPTIELTYLPDSIVLPNKNITLVASANPSLFNNTFQWFRNGGVVAGATGASLQVGVDQIGIYTVRVTSPDGCSATSVPRLVSAGYSERIWIYPNPSTGRITVRHINDRPTTVGKQLVISDLSGRKVLESKFILSNPYTPMNLDLSGMPRGIYVLSVRRSDGTELVSEKLILQ